MNLSRIITTDGNFGGRMCQSPFRIVGDHNVPVFFHSPKGINSSAQGCVATHSPGNRVLFGPSLKGMNKLNHVLFIPFRE